jgi:hypothetical protein
MSAQAAFTFLVNNLHIVQGAFQYALREDDPRMDLLRAAANDMKDMSWISAVANIDEFCLRTHQQDQGARLVEAWRGQLSGPVFNRDTVPPHWRR